MTLTMKTCTKCQQGLPLDCFYRRKNSKIGYTSHCRQCLAGPTRDRAKRRLAREPERIRAINRKKAKDSYRRRREAILKKVSRYRAENREKIRAQSRVYSALRNGSLVRPCACSTCFSHCKPDAHHTDYAEPLEVQWLCRSCHHLLKS